MYSYAQDCNDPKVRGRWLKQAALQGWEAAVEAMRC